MDLDLIFIVVEVGFFEEDVKVRNEDKCIF